MVLVRKTKTVLAVLLMIAGAVYLLRPGFRNETGRRNVGLEREPILLAARLVDPKTLPMPPDPPRESLSSRGTCAYAVQCATPVSAALRKRAADLGVRVISFIPRNALLVEASPSAVRSLLATVDFSAAFAYLPEDKVQRGLTGGLVTVLPLAEADRVGLEAYVTAEGGTVRPFGPSRQGSFRAEVSDDLLQKLAVRGDVRWLERHVPPKASNDHAVADTGVREVWNPHGLTGRGQVIASADTGLDTGDLGALHRDFSGRVVDIVNLGGRTTGDYCGHGTHTAGTLAGSGEMSDGQYCGVVPDANLFIQACGDTNGSLNIYFDNAQSYSDIFAAGVRRGAYVHSDSWGGNDKGAYSDMSVGLDEVVWNNPDLLVVVANGNSGSGRQTVGTPATAKNSLSVGNAYSSRSVANVWKINGSSSRGPCADGRIKPEIAAPGTSIVSTRSSKSSNSSYDGNTSYTKMSGTSMAAPHVAGCAALVRQWLSERQGVSRPTAALVKAVLTGGARGSLPDNDVGWGRLSLEETLFPSNRAVRVEDRIPYSNGCALKYRVTVTNESPLDVQLCWVDYPGEASAARALVNDLDLVVSNRTTGVVSYGNAVEGGDRLNNTESVRIPSASVGEYDVLIVGASVPYDSSDGGAAALYIRGAFDPDSVEEPELVTLTVSVEAGAALADVRPAVGIRKVEKGSTVVFFAPEWAYQCTELGTAFARQAFRGHVGTGDAPASGLEREFRVTVSNDTSVVWRYDERVSDYLLSCCAYLEGVPDDDYNPYVYEAWLTNGTTFRLSFPADAAVGEAFTYTGRYKEPGAWWAKSGTYVFRLGSVAYARTDDVNWTYLFDDQNGELCRAVDITMDEGVDLWSCYFNETEQSYDGLPYWWYMRYLWGGEMMFGYDSSAAGDPDGDGFSNAAEYADSTDPVDDESFRFRIDAFSPQGMTFTGSTNGNLVVERCALPGGEWIGIQTNYPPRTSVTNAVRFSGNLSTNGFYRVIYLR